MISSRIYPVDPAVVPRCGTSSPLAQGAFPLLPLHPHLDHCVNRRLLAPIHPHELMREDAKLMEGVVSVIRFPVALLDQFFTSSTSSFMSLSKPFSSCTFWMSSAYSPGSSIFFTSGPAPITPYDFCNSASFRFG